MIIEDSPRCQCVDANLRSSVIGSQILRETQDACLGYRVVDGLVANAFAILDIQTLIRAVEPVRGANIDDAAASASIQHGLHASLRHEKSSREVDPESRIPLVEGVVLKASRCDALLRRSGIELRIECSRIHQDVDAPEFCKN